MKLQERFRLNWAYDPDEDDDRDDGSNDLWSDSQTSLME